MTPYDTICALATPPGTAGLGVIRVSGAAAFAVTDAACRRGRGGSCAVQRGFTLRRATVTEANGDAIDEVLLAVFHAPRSYSGEDMVELSAHGGPVVLRRIVSRLLEAGARMALPGEFTQRAFLNGKMDLAQAEAVADIIHARTDSAHRLAVRQSAGHLSQAVRAIRSVIVNALAALEASLDFPEDVGEWDAEACDAALADAICQIETLLQTADRGILAREGAAVALAGRPNVGKSSLLNALLRAPRALVTDVPGTTRDLVEEAYCVRGIPIRLQDTAGLRETTDPVETLGVARARETVADADLVLLVLDASAGETAEDAALRVELTRPHLLVWNKWDLVTGERAAQPPDGIPLSAATGWNVSTLEDALADALEGGAALLAENGTVVTHVRHRAALEDARRALSEARQSVANGQPADFAAVDMAGALDALGRITGESAPEEVVHALFSRFCLGK